MIGRFISEAENAFVTNSTIGYLEVATPHTFRKRFNEYTPGD